MQLSKILQERAEGLVSEIQKPLDRKAGKNIISILGDVGLGKTSLLYALTRRLADIGLLPVFVSPPFRAVDTAPAVILQIADAFRKYGLMNGDGETLTRPEVHLDVKLDLLGKVASANRTNIVLLCDEPREWLKAESEDFDDHYVQYRKQKVVSELSRWDCRMVFAGALPESIHPSIVTQHKLPFDCVRVHEQPSGGLQEVVDTLVNRLGAKLSVATALARRLLMAFAKATSVDAAIELYNVWPDAWTLADKLTVAISDDVSLAPVRDAWARLALFRGPINPDLLNLIGIDNLSSEQRAIVYDGLLQQTDGAFLMHGMLKRMKLVSRWQESIRSSAHELFANYFKKKCVAWNPKDGHLGDTLEGFHHAVFAGERDARQTFPVVSIEQLHVLGRVLSKQLHDHVGAAKVFEEVVRLDHLDDYGHHYWAYNIDWEAADEALAEREYKRAVELNPEHPWWWSRWINFLITTGKLSHARSEWNRANTALGVRECDPDDRVWRALHLWVARLLLHRGQVEFARYVLSDVHEELRKKDPQFVALGHLLQFLDQAEDEESVFPWCVSPDHWWTSPYPHLTFDLELDGKPLKRWYPGRVVEVDEEAVWLIVGKKPESPEQFPTFGRIPIARQQFDSACRDAASSQIEPNRYLELAFYGDEDVLQIRCHPSMVQMDSNLPGFDPPDPRRYLSRSDI